MRPQDSVVIVLLFASGFLGALAAGGEGILPPLVKLLVGAAAIGCGAVLAVLRPVGTSIRPHEPSTRDERVQRVRDAAPPADQERGRG